MVSVATIVPVGQKIRLAREYARPPLSQYDLADRLQTKRSAVANWETERSMPSDRWVQAIASAVGVPFDWFYDGLPGPPRQSPNAIREQVAQYDPITLAPVRSWVADNAGFAQDTEIVFLSEESNAVVPLSFLTGGANCVLNW